MKKIGFLFLIFYFSLSVAFCQKGYYISKDYRIKKYEKEIVRILITDNQLPDNQPFKLDYYQGRIFIQKCLEIFPTSGLNGILIIKFGSLGDHSNRYFGILNDHEKLLMPYKFDDDNLTTFLKHCDSKTRAIIINYIQLTLKAEMEE